MVMCAKPRKARRTACALTVNTILGLPSIEAEESSEEDSQRPLINGAENEDDYEPNYSVQEDRAVVQVKAISFHQACCLPGVIPVRAPCLLPQLASVVPSQRSAGWKRAASVY